MWKEEIGSSEHRVGQVVKIKKIFVYLVSWVGFTQVEMSQMNLSPSNLYNFSWFLVYSVTLIPSLPSTVQLPSRCQDKVWHFERVPGFELRGRDDKVLTLVQSRRDCIEVSDKSDVCTICMMLRETKQVTTRFFIYQVNC